MSGILPRRFRVCGTVFLACLPALTSPAQSGAGSGADIPPSSTSQQKIPPAAPPVRSPVDVFRELLAMSPSRQREALAGRPPENQRQILAKIREYESLGANDRELRLRSTELRWYLLPLMQTPATNRAAQFAGIPAEVRGLVEGRIAAWDQVPTDLQRELLESEAAIRHLNEVRSHPEALPALPLSRELDLSLARWHVMSQTHQTKVLARFEEFFGLNSREQQMALESLSTTERRQIEQTIKSFSGLSPSQRAQCIRSLLKYVNLASAERLQFLKDAERWKLMPPDQRKAWRDLVARLSLQPPLPPGAVPAAPPLPPGSPRTPVTNGN